MPFAQAEGTNWFFYRDPAFAYPYNPSAPDCRIVVTESPPDDPAGDGVATPLETLAATDPFNAADAPARTTSTITAAG